MYVYTKYYMMIFQYPYPTAQISSTQTLGIFARLPSA